MRILVVFVATLTLAQVVEIPDPFFKACLVADFDQDGDGEISVSEAQSVTEIRCQARGIETLTGLDAFINLRVLDVDQNDITALPIAALGQLEVLEFGENRVQALPDLAALSSLRSIYCSSNAMSQMGSLPDSLEELRCGGNILTELPELPTGLKNLSCAWNELAQAPNVSQLTDLRSLSMGHNSFSELPSLSHLSELEYLEIEGLGLTEIPDLSGFSQLMGLEIGDNPLIQLPDIDQLQIAYLSLAGLDLTELPDLRSHPLESLYGHRNQLTQVDQIAEIPSLNFLNLNENRLTSLPSMVAMEDLCCLFVQDNQLSDIPDGLNDLERLSLFFIQNNQLDQGDCADILELNQKEGLTFVYSQQAEGALDCSSLGDIQSVIPWVVQNSQWTSRVSLFNAGDEDTSVQLKAVTRSGDMGEKIIEIPANSVFVAASEELFGALTGYAISVHSPSESIYPSFITFNRDAASKASPAQTVGLFPNQWGQHLLFGYLPGDMVPALVLLAPEMSVEETELECMLFSESGATGISATLRLQGNRPLALVVTDMFQIDSLPAGAAVKVRSTNGALLAGTSFVFNNFLEPSMTIPFVLEP